MTFLKKPLKTRPAELHFMQTPFNTWTGSLILIGNTIVDMENHGRRLRKSQRPFCRLSSVPGRYFVCYEAQSRGGRRHAYYASLEDAQRACHRWAGRRFRVVVEEEDTTDSLDPARGSSNRDA